MRRFALILALLTLLPGWAGAQDRSVAPGVNRSYENPDFAGWRAVFENEGREIHEHRHAIVEALAIRPGMVVAEVSAAGFVLERTHGFLRENYFLEFRKP